MLKIGHRGASAHYPENSLQAFFAARALGADGVEFDVRCCGSGEPVILHDATLDRTTTARGYLRDRSWNELRDVKLSNAEPLLRLEALLEALGPHCHYFAEAKEAEAFLPTARILQGFIQRGYPAENIWLIGFDHRAFGEIGRSWPGLQLGASWKRWERDLLPRSRALGARAVLPNHHGISARRIAQAHDLQLHIIPWTVNHPARIDALRKYGVDGLIGDYPERL
jgi:glycerophosphoryl diester phosphodiesterase